MEWSKLKNVILILLAATNLGLLSFVWSREWRQTQQLQQAREQAVEFLDSHGVEVSHDQIPEHMELLPQKAERDVEQERSMAASLLGDQIQQDSLDGEVCCYFNENGWVRFQNDGSFAAQFASGFLPLGKDREQSCLKILEQLGFEGKLVKIDGNKLTFCQNWKGTPIFNHQVTLTCEEGALTAMAGHRLSGGPATVEGWEPVTVATAVFDFYNGLTGMGDVCSRIDAIHLGYVSSTELSGPTLLTPVWRVDTDTGRYQLDTMTGQLTRLP